MQIPANHAVSLTQRQARCLLDILSVGLTTLLDTVRTLRQDSSMPAIARTTNPDPGPRSVSPTQPPPASPVGPTLGEFPSLSREATPRVEPHRGARPTPAIPTRRTLSYADRLRSQHQSSDGESRRRLAGRILVAPPPMQRRLLPLTREPQARLSSELAGVRVVYVRGLLRMPFREMRGFLRDLSPSLTPRSLLSISYFGPITSFICLN